jgi:two-component system, NtrC family, response regulator
MSEADRILLVVDDDPGMRSQLKWGLSAFNVITAKDRQNALDMLSEYSPAVVTLDLGLPPDIDGSDEGFEILRLILDAAPATHVLIVSGSINADNAKKAVEYGAYGCLSKPVDMVKLNAAVERAYQEYVTGKAM